MKDVSDRYFRYATRTTVEIDTPEFIDIPSVSTCYSFQDVASISDLERNLNVKLERGFSQYGAISNLTVADWFKYTPKIEDVFLPPPNYAGCIIRFPGQYVVSYMKDLDCNKLFAVTKYIRDRYVCYRFDPKFKQKIKVQEYVLSPMYTGMIYQINFNNHLFRNVSVSYHSIHTNTSSVLLDTIYSKAIVNVFINPRSLPSSMLSYREFRRIRKQPPYVPSCNLAYNSYGTAMDFELTSANKEFMLKYKTITPFVPVYEQDSKCLVPSELSFKNQTFIRMINNTLKNNRVFSLSCIDEFMITENDIKEDNKVSTRVYWPSAESIRVKYVPDQEILDFIIYISSCVGTWYGLSIFSSYDAAIWLMNRTTRKGGNECKEELGSIAPLEYKKDMRKCNMQIQYLKRVVHNVNTRLNYMTY